MTPFELILCVILLTVTTVIPIYIIYHKEIRIMKKKYKRLKKKIKLFEKDNNGQSRS